jgi:predicted anti-sigma-YlaC factor YlaD
MIRRDNKNKSAGRDKNRCKAIGLMLADYASNELSPGDMHVLESHVKTCPHCREEFLLVQRINHEMLLQEEACADLMTSMDWTGTARTISDGIPFKPETTTASQESWRRWRRFHWADLAGSAVPFKWKLALPVLAGIFLLGIGLGYIFFHTPSPALPPGAHVPGERTSNEISVALLEDTLAKREVAGYLKQTQLVLTDMMKHCETDDSFSIGNRVDIQRVRTLLNKSSYFKRNLDDPQLMSNKLLMKKIEWLLYEILMTDADEKNTCRELQRLQDYIKQERLLLKIRLAEEELSLSEV